MEKRKAVSVIVLAILFGLIPATAMGVKEEDIVDQAPAQRSLVDGDPALQFVYNGWTTYIAVTQYKGALALKLQSERTRGGDGYLYISANAVSWEPAINANHGDQAFSFPVQGLSISPVDAGCRLSITGNTIYFTPLSEKNGKFRPGNGQALHEYVQICTTSVSNFQAALQAFRKQVGGAVWESSSIGKEQRQAFEQRVTAWHAAAIKPAMPDEAHVHQVLAENAVREKDFDKAIDEYEAALEIFPTWPDGQNNLAFLCGETGDYDCGVEHAQDYLELVPNAPDAQAVKDKIIIWKDKLAQSQTTAAPPAAQPQKRSKK
jgi:tetratricopeptide (TPR) repeat protein